MIQKDTEAKIRGELKKHKFYFVKERFFVLFYPDNMYLQCDPLWSCGPLFCEPLIQAAAFF